MADLGFGVGQLTRLKKFEKVLDRVRGRKRKGKGKKDSFKGKGVEEILSEAAEALKKARKGALRQFKNER